MKKFWSDRNVALRNPASKLRSFVDPVCLRVSYPMSALKYVSFFLAILISTKVVAQSGDAKQKQADYKKVLTERVTKIINPLGIGDSAKYHKVLSVVVNQYYRVNEIQDDNKEKATKIKTSSLSKEDKEAALKALEQRKSGQLLLQHKEFIDLLKNNLPDAQVDKVKDGMTYSVAPKTYNAYLDMIPSLTAVQKEKIYDWLQEARELAMDEGSSEKKHAVFGKYKGRINNYLSAQGYDLKKEGEDWEKRRNAAKGN